MFCASCGKEVASGVRFCPACGVGIAEPNLTSAPAPSVAPERSVATQDGSAAPKKPLSAWHGVLIGVGLLLCILVLAAVLGDSARPLIGLAVLGTSVWASIDSYQIRRRYKAKDTTAQPLGLFLFMLLLWIIFFPIYLVQRSRVLARFGRSEDFQPPSSQQPTSEAATGGSGQVAGRRSTASKWVAPALAVLVIVDGAFNPNVSSTMKKHMNADASWADVVKSLFDFSSAAAGQAPIWQTTEAQLAAANTTAGTPTPQTSTVEAAATASEAPAAKPTSGGTDHGLLESCISGGQQPELVCLSEELDRQDARLNKEYQRVMAQYKQLGQGDNIATLRKAELDWIKHVKSDCDTTPPGFMGNPDHRRIECSLDSTKARADELAKMPQ
jgi:uncharacterized protein YecT (DUF1311 family)